MTARVQQILDAFDTLPPAEKREAAAEILRRLAGTAEGDVPEDALAEAADELFRALDAEEDRHAPR
jgi:hypothetical protein